MTSSPLRTLIVDDEPLANEAIRELLLEYDEISVVACCDNAFDAIEAIQQQKPDLILLDIHLPVMSGLELLERVNTVYRPKVIIVSAYQDHALKAFQADVVDYVLKPVEPLRLKRAVDKVVLFN